MKENQMVENEMYEKAIEFLSQRYPQGWGGVAIIRSDEGHYFTSVPIETGNASASLCIEVGAMCEAHKYNVAVSHCLCVVRDDENSPFKVLSPCGICQERLRYWGDKVRVAVTTLDKTLKFVPLSELQPYHWTQAFAVDELAHYKKQE